MVLNYRVVNYAEKILQIENRPMHRNSVEHKQWVNPMEITCAINSAPVSETSVSVSDEIKQCGFEIAVPVCCNMSVKVRLD